MNRKTYSEILISDKPDSEIFKNLCSRLKSEFNAELIEEIEGFDSKYYDFRIVDSVLTLHLQIYIGITIFSKELDNATQEENLLVETIGMKLKINHD